MAHADSDANADEETNEFPNKQTMRSHRLLGGLTSGLQSSGVDDRSRFRCAALASAFLLFEEFGRSTRSIVGSLFLFVHLFRALSLRHSQR